MRKLLFLLLLAGCGTLQPIGLINGRVANPADWPASVRTSQRCSATIVGPRTLLMAAHCAGTGAVTYFEVKGQQYSAVCTRHPEYTNSVLGDNKTADWALCYTNRQVTGITFETLNVNPTLVYFQDTLTLTGMGCTQPGGGAVDFVLRIGEAKVSVIPQWTSYHNYDIVTFGGAALCYSDSGGGAYKYVNGRRFLVGVNSRGNISTLSYISAVHVFNFRDWANRWATQRGTGICGLHAVQGCR